MKEFSFIEKCNPLDLIIGLINTPIFWMLIFIAIFIVIFILFNPFRVMKETSKKSTGVKDEERDFAKEKTFSQKLIEKLDKTDMQDFVKVARKKLKESS